ncbi:MAG: hydroxysqualene dehydroxylase HpnE, partial [Planctomycetes bacterium]|nr:hydroxysqualene dehydroxylase HpnE [Planctomycetota bacterium]
MNPSLVVGGGMAGIAAALSLSARGRQVILIEKRSRLGGRASSFLDRRSGEVIDNCQHVLLGCCTTVQSLLEDLKQEGQIAWSQGYDFLLPDGGGAHRLQPSSWLPAPLHYLPSLLRFGALSPADRLRLIRVFLIMMWAGERSLRRATRAPIEAWLDRRGVGDELKRRFFEPILVGAVNETLDRAAAWPSFQVFLQGFLPHRRAAALGVARVPLDELFARPAREKLEAQGHEVRTSTRVTDLETKDGRCIAVRLASGERLPCGEVVMAVPPSTLASIAVDDGEAIAEVPSDWDFSPITGIHLWMDRQVVDRPHAALLESPIHWVFPKTVAPEARKRLGAVQRLQVVIS